MQKFLPWKNLSMIEKYTLKKKKNINLYLSYFIHRTLCYSFHIGNSILDKEYGSDSKAWNKKNFIKSTDFHCQFRSVWIKLKNQIFYNILQPENSQAVQAHHYFYEKMSLTNSPHRPQFLTTFATDNISGVSDWID